MSRRRLACVFLGLGLGFLFYLAYRTDRTLGNRLAAQLCGPSAYAHLKQDLRHWLPVPPWLRGCLPSALWCFIVTSLCGGWKLRLGRRLLPITWLAPLFNATWELVQWAGWTDGRADWHDAVAGVAGWWLAQGLLNRPGRPAEEIAGLWNWRAGVAMTGIATMGLADVWK